MPAPSTRVNVPSGNPGTSHHRVAADHVPVRPQARQMNGIDFGTYVVSSRYVTVNLVMILVASAVLVAALTLGFLIVDSHATLGFTVGLTSAGTVLVTAITRRWAAGKRRKGEHHRERDDGPAGE